MARRENPGAKGQGVRSPSLTVPREMNRPVLILIEACSPHAGNSHSSETGARGAKQESVGNAAAGIIVGVECQTNLNLKSELNRNQWKSGPGCKVNRPGFTGEFRVQ
jgi:hypothetical protein